MLDWFDKIIFFFINYVPGGAWVVLNFNDKALKFCNKSLTLLPEKWKSIFSLTLNTQDWRHRKLNTIPTNFYLNASKCPLEGILENLSAQNSCQYRWCMSMHAENILLVVVAMDSESKIVFYFRTKPELVIETIVAYEIQYLMKSDEFSNSKHLCVVSCCAGIKPLDYRWYVTEYTCIHECWKKLIEHFFLLNWSENITPIYEMSQTSC